MKKYLIICLLLALYACAKVPITGRRQMHMLPESQLMTMAISNYNQFLKDKPALNDTRAKKIKQIGDKISKAVNQYMIDHGHSKRIAGYNWEFNLVNDPAVNAWCMPGGKVVFYTGILPYTLNDTGIAVVMGHEIAHAIARHGNERMSQGLALQVGGASLQVALSEKSEQTQNLFLQSYGLASTIGSLKYSRKHESEADKMGLVFMALAGYNPEGAVDFWKRMSTSGGQKPPEILSTHPHDDTRIADIKAYLPEALKHYKK
ncbi:M48 family metallopeptidase [Flavobacteriales bacterium]|nr:M48 family metallopeptidase [Flavobacteriales bacterium]